MKPLLFFLNSILFISIDAIAQQPLIFENYKHLSPDEVLEVEGEEIAFQMKNVCYDDILFGFSETDSAGSYISNPPYVIDSSINADLITGISGLIGNTSNIYFTGTDTLYYRIYESIINNTLRAKVHVPNIITLVSEKGSLNTWVICNAGDSVHLISVTYTNSNFQFMDTVPLPVNEIINDEGNIYKSSTVAHIMGRDSMGDLHYFRFDLFQGNITHHINLNYKQERLLYVDGYQDKTLFFFDKNNELIMHELELPTLNSAISTFGMFDSIIDVSGKISGHSYPIAAIVIDNGDFIAKQYNAATLGHVSDHQFNVIPEKLYSASNLAGSFNSYQDYLEYSDSTGQRYIAPVELDFEIINNLAFKIQESPGAYCIASICFVGIEENDLPGIKTYLYPNPASDQVTVIVKNVPCDMEHHLELYDMHGKKLYATPFHSKCAVNVPIRELTAGMYLVKMQINHKTYVRKILKK